MNKFDTMRSTTRAAVMFLVLGTLLTILPVFLSFILLPLRLLGSLLILIGFRLVIGSRTDDVPRYKGKAVMSTIMYAVYIVLYPVAGFFLVLSFLRSDSSVWRILFYVTLAIMGGAYSLAFALFQMPLRRGFGRVMLMVVAVLSILFMAVLPPLSGAPSSYAADKAGTGLDTLRQNILDKLRSRNESFNIDVGNQSQVENASASDFARYVVAMMLNPLINETRNATSDVLWAARNATVTFIAVSAPVLMFDVGHSIATLLWMLLLSGTIVTMGRLEQEEGSKDGDDGPEDVDGNDGSEDVSPVSDRDVPGSSGEEAVIGEREQVEGPVEIAEEAPPPSPPNDLDEPE